MELRPYQQRAETAVRRDWAQGSRSVCLVSPTGSGKTVLGQSLIDPSDHVLWVEHTRELVIQTADRLSKTADVGIVMPGFSERPSARIQIGTVQTLLARQRCKPFDKLVLDECHHYLAETWRAIAEIEKDARIVGLTATPERQDGTPLGDMFSSLVVAASYSELLALGHLVPSRVYQPADYLGPNLASDPVAAWLNYAEGGLTFAYEPRVALAEELARQFRAAGIAADTISAETPTVLRDARLSRLKRGMLRVITNVNTLTEGVDVPELRVVLLARQYGFAGGLIQAVGRALRPAEGKADAIIIDLCGSTIRHGLPGQDRIYSLTGRAITPAVNERTCQAERVSFSRDVVDTGLVLAAPGAMTRERVEEVRTRVDRVTQRQGKSVGDMISRMAARIR